jgi:hypothetical protein
MSSARLGRFRYYGRSVVSEAASFPAALDLLIALDERNLRLIQRFCHPLFGGGAGIL